MLLVAKRYIGKAGGVIVPGEIFDDTGMDEAAVKRLTDMGAAEAVGEGTTDEIKTEREAVIEAMEEAEPAAAEEKKPEEDDPCEMNGMDGVVTAKKGRRKAKA